MNASAWLTVALALCASVFAPPAQAQETRAQRQAQIAHELFAASCLAHYGDEAALAEWVRSRGFGRTDPAFTRAVLQGERGEVWSATDESGEYVILLKPRGNCEVWARRADAQTAVELFERALLDARRPGRRIEREDDRTIDAHGARYRMVAYSLYEDGRQGGWAFIAIASASAAAEVQLRLSADWGR
ncbi:hypothetical protein FBR04_10545 [Betaproteobacteria bacterium PRO7]|jgi:hypothetical protein|nr:hypothetical protein [Betaproteobacteria bacterium PRO7]